MLKKKCLTLIAQQETTEKELDNLLSSLIEIATIKPHADSTRVYDVFCSERTQLSPELRAVLYAAKLDFALQSAVSDEKKLFLSDMDSTITVTETIDEIATIYSLGQAVSEITAAAMRGEMDYQDALLARLSLLKGISKSELLSIVKETEITPGARELLDEVNRRKIISCLISGGFTLFTDWIGNKLGFQHQVANILDFDAHDCLNGRWVGGLVTAEVKLATLKQLAMQNQLSLSQTVAIGDGANDIEMIKAAGLGVAFYGKPALREVAQAEIHSGNIDNLIYFL